MLRLVEKKAEPNWSVFNTNTGKFVKFSKSNSGYYQGKVNGKVVHLHRVVAEALVKNPKGHPMVLHRNDIKGDNRVENLYWGTARDNALDRVKNGIQTLKAETNPNSKLNWQDVNWIRTNYRKGSRDRFDFAEKFDVSDELIYKIASNQLWPE